MALGGAGYLGTLQLWGPSGVGGGVCLAAGEADTSGSVQEGSWGRWQCGGTFHTLNRQSFSHSSAKTTARPSEGPTRS